MYINALTHEKFFCLTQRAVLGSNPNNQASVSQTWRHEKLGCCACEMWVRSNCILERYMHWVLSLGSIGACNLAGGPITGFFPRSFSILGIRVALSASKHAHYWTRSTGRQTALRLSFTPQDHKVTPRVAVAGCWLLVAGCCCWLLAAFVLSSPFKRGLLPIPVCFPSLPLFSPSSSYLAQR